MTSSIISNQFAYPFNTPTKYTCKEKLIIAELAFFKNFIAINNGDTTVELP